MMMMITVMVMGAAEAIIKTEPTATGNSAKKQLP